MVVYKSAIVSAPSSRIVSQRERETPSDSPPALTGCLIRARWILANDLRGSRWSHPNILKLKFFSQKNLNLQFTELFFERLATLKSGC